MKRNRNILLLLAIMLMGLLFGSCSNDQVDDFFKKFITPIPPFSHVVRCFYRTLR